MLRHCQVDNGTSVSQYLCSSESAYTKNGKQINVVSMYQVYLLILSAAFQCDVVYRYDLIPNFDSPILKEAKHSR